MKGGLRNTPNLQAETCHFMPMQGQFRSTLHNKRATLSQKCSHQMFSSISKRELFIRREKQKVKSKNATATKFSDKTRIEYCKTTGELLPSQPGSSIHRINKSKWRKRKETKLIYGKCNTFGLHLASKVQSRFLKPSTKLI